MERELRTPYIAREEDCPLLLSLSPDIPALVKSGSPPSSSVLCSSWSGWLRTYVVRASLRRRRRQIYVPALLYQGGEEEERKERSDH